MNARVSFEAFSALFERLSSGKESPEWALLSRYDLLRNKCDLPFREKLYRCLRAVLTEFHLASPRVTRFIWTPALKHVPCRRTERVLLIWAVGVGNAAKQRNICNALQAALAQFSGLLPVLLTDCADFAFFSRLGWQVEYLPALPGEGDDYVARKCAYLAWRYRGALVLPLADDAVLRLMGLADGYSTVGPG